MKLTINPPSYRKTEGVGNIHPDLQPHFCMLIVGKPGSGKSHLIEELILNSSMYYKKFNKIFFVGGSGFTRLPSNPNNSNSVFDPTWMLEKINENPEAKNILFVLDDVIGEIKAQQNNPDLMKLVFNRRHILNDSTISYIITTQKYMVCPARLRSCISCIMFFQVQKADFKKIMDEVVFQEIDKYTYTRICKHLIDHNFCYIRLDNSKIYLNFEKLL